MEDIFDIIKETFNSLWSVKKYGKTIEIVTPLFTTNDCFVSVFLTEREGYYIITDGGWISENYYNNFFDSELTKQNLKAEHIISKVQIKKNWYPI